MQSQMRTKEKRTLAKHQEGDR